MYLDSSISSNDNNLTIPCYDLYRADYLSNAKRGWSLYLLQQFTSIEGNRHSISTSFFNFKMRIGEKLCKFIILYCSPSQSQDGVETVLKN